MAAFLRTFWLDAMSSLSVAERSTRTLSCLLFVHETALPQLADGTAVPRPNRLAT
jgi:hypothetical protein